jgi:hypothetical protein
VEASDDGQRGKQISGGSPFGYSELRFQPEVRFEPMTFPTAASGRLSGPWAVLVDPGRSATIRPVTFGQITVISFAGRGGDGAVVRGRLIAAARAASTAKAA